MATKQCLSPAFFQFFRELAPNNHKDWFDSNRQRYEKDVKIPFENLVTALIEARTKTDPSMAYVLAKDCIFRINRDVRFSKDKSPYKLNRSAIIGPHGRKDMGPSGIYIEAGPETCALYAGSYMPEKPLLAAIRNKIMAESARWKAIVSDKAFVKTFGGVRGEQQTRVAAEWKEASIQLPVLKNTQFYIMAELSESEFTQAGIAEKLLKLWDTAGPYIAFLTEAAGSVDS
ncbi:MAG: DUF2461 domain-containing protein [Bacteroidetes bacterium]|nr:DUF2461 domain-containing protein [Bacteroidota bacterium]